jgi:DNA polymerase-4
VLEHVGLPITVGVARTKFQAQVASAVAKPDGQLVVPPHAELAFLPPRPLERRGGGGPVTSAKLRDRGLLTVGEVAALPQAALVSLLGRAAGLHLHALAHNRDPRPVQVGRRRRSIGSQCALGRGPTTHDDLTAVLLGLVDRVTRRMRMAGRVGRTVTLRLRFDDFTRATRSHTLRSATAGTAPILSTAMALLDHAMPLLDRRGCTLLGVAVSNLVNHGAEQLTLPFAPYSATPLDTAVDDVRERFGSAAVTRGALMGRDPRPSVPLLPD